ncbi:MAG: 30S ribosomal protein S8 [Candidatus Gracilibacteria bacterium]|nr:30S ribosomal protein S8 [bacterium]MDZ4217055.1 30S ribosomal protein S8 [Candidatus Gracilibacteria bacterium]
MNTDPIADLLTRIRNANMAQHEVTTVPSSKIKREILRVMKEKAFIKDFQESKSEGPQKTLSIQLLPGKKLNLKRISRPGQRIYKTSQELFPVLRGYGFSIVSTSQGIMTGDEARKKRIGGEIICEIH